MENRRWNRIAGVSNRKHFRFHWCVGRYLIFNGVIVWPSLFPMYRRWHQDGGYEPLDLKWCDGLWKAPRSGRPWISPDWRDCSTDGIRRVPLRSANSRTVSDKRNWRVAIGCRTLHAATLIHAKQRLSVPPLPSELNSRPSSWSTEQEPKSLEWHSA